ncbi:MAG TPA: M4 family metallopeptidase [Ornithinibacter sp.]|nr:M4 family metallopeptidase [Ornithinibacter sp.]
MPRVKILRTPVNCSQGLLSRRLQADRFANVSPRNAARCNERNSRTSRGGAPAPPPLTCRGPPRRPGPGESHVEASPHRSSESGGLNEATSDIFGTAVEWYANTAADVPDYLVGEKININGNGTPLRYLDRPSKDGRSADCWSKSVGRLNVHYSSGPLNHWFYSVCEGSGTR